MDMESQMLSLLDHFRNCLPAKIVEHVDELSRAGECPVALEELCNYLVEQDAHVSSEMLARLAALGEALKVDPSYWDQLSEQTTSVRE